MKYRPTFGSKELLLAFEAVEAAGAVVLENFTKPKQVEEKLGDAGVVTETDRQAEAAILSILRKGSWIPILAEESGGGFGQVEEKWIVDPLDGTTNFSRGIPFFAVSIALLRGRKSAIGVTLDVMNRDCYFAEEGVGAFLNGEPLRIEAFRAAGKPVLIIESGYRREDEALVARLAGELAGKFTIRKQGSTALQLCQVAAGLADAFVTAGDEIWDYAAGVCLVEESGGAAVDWSGKPWNNSSSFLIAGKPDIVDQLVPITSLLLP